MSDITVVINSCDAYEDVLIPLFSSLKDMWKDLPYPIMLNTESKPFSFPGFAIKTLGAIKGYSPKSESWGQRLLRHLGEVESNYVVMIFDDYILEKPVDTDRIEKCKTWLENNPSIGAFYLVEGGFNKIDDKRFQDFSRIKPRSDYIVNSAPAIWNKGILESFLGKNDTPWAWEYFGSARAYRYNTPFYAMTTRDDEIYKYQYDRGGAIHQGKWVRAVIEPAIKKYSLMLDCSIRGYDEEKLARRKITWYIRFYLTGWRMVRWDVFVFIKRAIARAIARPFKKYFGKN